MIELIQWLRDDPSAIPTIVAALFVGLAQAFAYLFNNYRKNKGLSVNKNPKYNDDIDSSDVDDDTIYTLLIRTDNLKELITTLLERVDGLYELIDERCIGDESTKQQRLTKQQRDARNRRIKRLNKNGKNTKYIAELLGISKSTVRTVLKTT